jgi:hypothetical protein
MERPSIDDYSTAVSWEHDDKDYERYAHDLDKYIDHLEALRQPPSFPSDDDIQKEAQVRFPEPEGYTNENQFNFSWGAKYMKRACEKAFEKRGNEA